MGEQLRPPALVTVMTLRAYGGVDVERFETPYEFRPVWINPAQVYSVETHPTDSLIRDIVRTMPVDVATWLHRMGVWDTMPADLQGR